MPGLLKRRFEEVEKLRYDSSKDIVYLESGYRGVKPIVGIRSIYADPDVAHLSDLMASDEIVLSGDALIQGYVLAGNNISYESHSDAPAVVIGDMGAFIRKDFERSEESVRGITVKGKSPLMVVGNILTDYLTVESPLIVVGNVSVASELRVEAPTLVLGRIVIGSRNQKGKGYVEKSTFFQLYAFGDLTLGPCNTTFLPIITSKGGTLELKSKVVRVFNLPCMFCGEVSDPFLCTYYLDSKCPMAEKGLGFDYLARYDLSKAGEYRFISWFWRSSPLMIVQNVLMKRLLYTAYRRARELRVNLGDKTVNGVSLKEFPEYVVKETIGELRRRAGKTLEEVKTVLFKTIEEYFQAKNIKYIKCSKCGAPNPEEVKVCIYCGESIT